MKSTGSNHHHHGIESQPLQCFCPLCTQPLAIPEGIGFRLSLVVASPWEAGYGALDDARTNRAPRIVSAPEHHTGVLSQVGVSHSLYEGTQLRVTECMPSPGIDMD